MGKVVLCYSFLALTALVSVSLAQDSSCLSQLMPCLEFTNSNKSPTSSCCEPLKSLVKSDPKCLCDMLGGNSSASQARVNMTQMQNLPSRCGLKVSAASCISVSSPTATAVVPSSPTATAVVPSSTCRTSHLNAVVAAGILVIIQIIWASSRFLA